MFSAYDVISKKKHGCKLEQAEIAELVASYVSGDVSDAQVAAFLMAVCLNGMDEEETFYLTEAMAASGEVMDTSEIPNLLDKHSTGGVGDKTSFIIVAMLSALGYNVGMMSGRGLGHTGGTLDKLESVEGFRCDYSAEEYLDLLKTKGAAIISQTGDLAPADKKMYALRNETATIDSVPLIAASIMSKKIASGTQNLVLDVKYGSGAFMKERDKASELARLMTAIGRMHGINTEYRLSSMDDVLGSAVGNAIEIQECLDIMDGKRSALTDNLRVLCIELAADLACMVESGKTHLDMEADLSHTLEDGSAKAAFMELLENQGCDVSNGVKMPYSLCCVGVLAKGTGKVLSVDVERIGLIAASLGANRVHSDDEVFHDVGIEVLCHLGDELECGSLLAKIHYGEISRDRLDRDTLDEAVRSLAECYVIG